MPSQQSPQAPPADRRSVLTLAIASASSVAAALVVSAIWGPGTLIGAAATPVIVILLGDLLHRPAEKISVIRVSSTGTELTERSAPAAPPVAGELAPRSVHRSRRRPVAVALATGMLAFAIGAVVLTGSELLLGDSSVGSGGGRTTVFGGPARDRPATREPEEPATTPTAPSTVTGTDPKPPSEQPSQTTTAPKVPAPPAETAPPATTQPTPVVPESGATAP